MSTGGLSVQFLVGYIILMIIHTPHRFFQPNQRLGSDSDIQNESIGGVSESHASNLLLDNIFWSDILKCLFLGFSDKSNVFTFLSIFIYLFIFLNQLLCVLG